MDSLPNELVEEICYCLEGKDLRNFRLVNKEINVIAEECFWNTETLVLDLNRQQLSAGMEMLEDLKNRCRSAGLVRAMVIDSLAPQKASRHQPLEEYKGFEGIEDDELKVVKEACETLPTLLPAAISALTNLRCITWGINSPDQDTVPNDRSVEWTHEAFSQLSNLPYLIEINLRSTASVPTIPLPPLECLRHLKYFTLKGNWDVSDTTVPWTLAPMIANNPDLVFLDLSPWCATVDHRSTFHRLFDNINSQSPPLQLDHLSLHGWMVTFTPSVVPHIRHLRSISLPYNSERYVGIWAVLKSEGVHLSDISMASAGNEFLDYMESFSGIGALTLCVPEAIPWEETSRMSRRFYDTALMKHAKTLCEFQILAVVDCPWTAGLDNVAIFGSCEDLISLTLPLRTGDVNPGQGEEHDVVARLISSVVHLRYLDFVCLKPLLRPFGPFNESPIQTKIAQERQRRKIVESLEKYKISNDRLPHDDSLSFRVSTLTPNEHVLVGPGEDNMMTFVREKTYDGDDSFYFIDLEILPVPTDNQVVVMNLADLDLHSLV